MARILSTPTTITITQPSGDIPAWVSSILPGHLASVPIADADRYGGANCSPQLGPSPPNMEGSDGAMSWCPSYGTHGGLAIYGGGHGTSQFCFVWIFDPAIPGWRVVNDTPPSGIDGNHCFTQPGLSGAAWKWDDGAEASTYQPYMPADAVLLNNYGPNMWFKPRINTDWWGYPNGTQANFPVSTRLYYGECATNIPLGFHPYNYFVAVPPGKLGMGAYGGLAGIGKASCTTNSAQGCVWGHKIDLQTGVWSRMPARIPNNGTNGSLSSGNGATFIENSTAITFYSSAVRQNYLYTVGGNSGIIRTDLDTGAHDCLQTTGPRNFTNNVEFLGDTTLLCNFVGENPLSHYNNYPPTSGSWTQWTIACADVNPALTRAQRPWFKITNWTPSNLLPIGAGVGYGGFMVAGLVWVPEVQKFALFGTSDPRYSPPDPDDDPLKDWPGGTWEERNGYWPPIPTIFWITPPADAQNRWNVDPWHIEKEELTVPATDPYATDRNNLVSKVDTSVGLWRNFHWCSSLRCFLFFNSPKNKFTYFIRSTKVP